VTSTRSSAPTRGERHDFLRESLTGVRSAPDEAEVSEHVRPLAARAEEARLTRRHGYGAWRGRRGRARPSWRSRGSDAVSTSRAFRAGAVAAQFLMSVVQEAYLASVFTGRSTRWLSRSGRGCPRAKSRASARASTSGVEAFRNRWTVANPLPANGRRGREGPRQRPCRCVSLVLAYGCTKSGYWELIDLDVGEAGNGGVLALLHALASTKSRLCDLTDGAVGLRKVPRPSRKD
jgi:hypothetical protein